MKKLLFALGLLSMSVTSCVLEIMDPAEQDARVYPEFFAEQVELFDSGLKTSLDEDRYLVWSAGDQLAIFQGSSIADKYQVKDSSDGQANASFSFLLCRPVLPGRRVHSVVADGAMRVQAYVLCGHLVQFCGESVEGTP